MPGVSFDAVGPSSAGTSTSTSPLTWTHVLGGTANYITAVTETGAAFSTDTLTCGGVSMTRLARICSNSAGGNTSGYVSLWGLASPPTGSQTMSFSSAAGALLIGGSVSYSGVGSVGTPVTGSSNGAVTAFTLPVTGTTSGGMCVAGAVAGNALTSPTQTTRWTDNVDVAGTSDNAAQQDAASTGGTVTLGWSIPTSDWWGAVAVELLPALTSAVIIAVPVLIPPGRMSPAAFPYKPVPPVQSSPVTLTSATDAAAAAEAPSVSASAPLSDTGAAADSPSVSATVPVADVAAGVEALAIPQVGTTEADAGAAAESVTVTVSASASDAGGATELPADTVTVSLADVAGAAEGTASGVPIGLADVAGAADAESVQASAPLPDAGAAAESSTATVTAAASEVAGAADALTAQASAPLTDTAGAAESQAVTATASAQDTAGAADGLAAQAAAQAQETAGAADAVSVQQQTQPALSEAAGAAEALSVTATVTQADKAAAAEALHAVNAGVADTAEWTARPFQPRWTAETDPPHWQAEKDATRWLAGPEGPRWPAAQLPSRWRASPQEGG